MDIDGLSHEQTFCPPGVDPYDTVEWTTYHALIENPSTGEVVFEQEGVEFPESWSQQSVNIVSDKYFFGDLDAENGDPANGKREYSLKQLIDRVADTIVDEGIDRGYFAYTSDASSFRNDLKWLLLHQHFAFNSPVWFNIGLGQAYGVKEGDEQNLLFNKPDAESEVEEVDPYLNGQAAACFIVEMEDDIDAIWDTMKDSARLFKFGSGVGADWSKLRSSKERVSGGGTASGPVTFMRVQDATGATIKSGGKTRRAAIMQILRADHPDIEEFVDVKREEEKKAHALIDAGYDSSFNGEAYGTADFQDVNMSVRVKDEFFKRASLEATENFYQTFSVDGESVINEYDPSDLLNKIAENTHDCGDPGLQYDGEIQRWHTCKETGRINGSNPCSEFLFLDNTACNLASINFRKIERENAGWDAEKLQDIAEIAFVSQDILCDFAGYPSEDIAEMSEDFRPLGLGFANLGASLMAHGIPYDSNKGRAIASALQANVHFAAYNASTKMAKELEPYPGYEENREVHNEVMGMHHQAAQSLFDGHHDYLDDIIGDEGVLTGAAAGLMRDALQTAEEMEDRGFEHGYRNSQATVIAPTGTISFYMGCTTTGIEPSPALVQYKNLAGEDDSQIKIVNDAVTEALDTLGYDEEEVLEINNYIQKHDTIEGAGPLKDEHLPVFDCAIAPFNGERSIDPYGHTDMMAGVQPFVSGAISKTVNLPEDATVEDIEETYLRGWKKGLKALAIYRDGSKKSQAVSTTDGSEESDEDSEEDNHLGETVEEAEDEILPFVEDSVHHDEQPSNVKDLEFEVMIEVAESLGVCLIVDRNDPFYVEFAGEKYEARERTAPPFPTIEKRIAHQSDEFFYPEGDDSEEVSDEIPFLTSSEDPDVSESMEDEAFSRGQDQAEALMFLRNELEEGRITADIVLDYLNVDTQREKLPDQAPSIRKKFRVGEVEGYIHVGLYPDTRKPGEVFITVSKEGSTLAGVMDAFATSLSLALQYGVPLEDLVQKFKNQRFEPSGFTGDEIQSATSIVDYVAQWLEQHFLKTQKTVPPSEEDDTYPRHPSDGYSPEWMPEGESDPVFNRMASNTGEEHFLDSEDRGSDETHQQTSGKVCHNCGSQMQQDGTCFTCPTCGEDTGCGG